MIRTIGAGRKATSQPRHGGSEQEAEMNRRAIFDQILSADIFRADNEMSRTRRPVLLAPLMTALPLMLTDTAAFAEKINPSETAVTLPDEIKWSGWINGFPPHSGEMATLYGGLDKPGLYVVLMKWYPGYMSAPHLRDRSALARSVGHLVGKQRSRFRSRQYGAGSGRRIRAACRANPAL
jgi:hypothetical protein